MRKCRLNPAISSTRLNTLNVDRFRLTFPRNTVQHNSYAYNWDAALSHLVTGELLLLPVSRFVSMKEFKVPPPSMSSQNRTRRDASDPAYR